MIPRRLEQIRPYLASLIHPRFERPPIHEMARWILQPGKEARAQKYIVSKSLEGDFYKVIFAGHERPFYYPANCSWIDLCQTVDECFNPKNWHCYLTPETSLGPEDTVLDCGAAEGLFSFIAAEVVKKVYAIEPIPMWHRAMQKTFAPFGNVELVERGVGHKAMSVRMTDEEINSKISLTGGVEIQIDTIDAMFFDRGIPVTYLKADVEGFEFPAILGAEATIRKNRPKIALTVYHETNHFAEIRDFLRNIHGDYRFKTRGLAANGNPILFLAF
jgi:FkbM family methyltransferase